MKEIKKISVNGVVYDIASTGGDVPVDVQEQLDNLNQEVEKLNDSTNSLNEKTDSLVNSDEEIKSSIIKLEESDTNLINSIAELNEKVDNIEAEDATKLIEEEANKRQEEDSKLLELINSESTSRSEEDTKLQENLELEATSRIEGDTKLQEDLKAESERVDLKLSEMNDNLTESINQLDQTLTESVNSINSIESEINDVIKPDLDKSVKYQEFELNGDKRKTIQLANYDSITGVTTTGDGVNVAMVSKWDKVDLGSSKVEINLNGSAEHPTYNDDHSLAFISDVDLVEDKINNLGVYSLGKIGSFNEVPNKLAQKDICTNANNVILTFVVSNTVYGDEGGYCTNIYTQKQIHQTLYWKNTVSSRTLTVTEEGEVQSAEFKPSGEDQVFLLNKAIIGPKFFSLTTESTSDDIKAAMTGTISKQLITDEDLTRCVTYGFMIKEEVMNGSIMVGWNGSSYTFTQVGYSNPNSTPVVRSITINITSQGDYSVVKNGLSGTIVTNNNISTYINPLQESISNIEGIISVLSSKVSLLQDKVDSLQSVSSENVPDFDGSSPINDSEKIYEVAGGNIVNTNTITAKNIVLNDSSLSNNARLSVLAEGAEFNNLSISGDFPKDDGGNAVVKINNSNNVSFSNLTFDSSNVYNGIEIGLNSTGSDLPKNILFDNCKFTGAFTNNTILVFGTQENATITLNNCSFESISNALRISNKDNVSGVTINIVNCSVEKWEYRPDYSDYAGFLILEDYTNKGSEAIASNNLFGNGKITINFINLMHNGVKILPSNAASVCGTKDENQVVYVCHDYADEGATVVPYDQSIYPTVTFK